MRLFTTTTLALLLSLPICSQALTCLNNETQINIGDTTEQVQSACGEPDNQTSEDTPITEQQQVMQWYYLANFTNQLIDADNDVSPAIIRLVLQFDSEDKVSHLQIYTSVDTPPNEKALKMIGSAINIGDSQKQVEEILEQPFAVKKVMTDVTVGKDTTETWTYEKGNKSQTLTFLNGALTDHETSSE